jgi:hypothetical protein
VDIQTGLRQGQAGGGDNDDFCEFSVVNLITERRLSSPSMREPGPSSSLPLSFIGAPFFAAFVEAFTAVFVLAASSGRVRLSLPVSIAPSQQPCAKDSSPSRRMLANSQPPSPE